MVDTSSRIEVAAVVRFELPSFCMNKTPFVWLLIIQRINGIWAQNVGFG